MTTAPMNVISQILSNQGFSPPNRVLKNIADFLITPSQMVKIREVSRGFNSLITENTRANRLFWDKHMVKRWGIDYGDYRKEDWCSRGSIQDRISLYVQLDQLEKAALRHLTLEHDAQMHTFDYNEHICFSIAEIAREYFKGKKLNPAWRYLFGMNILCRKFERALFHLILSWKKGYKKGEDRFELALKSLFKASKTDKTADVLLTKIKKGQLPQKEIWQAAIKFHLGKLSRENYLHVNDNKDSTCGKLEHATPPLPLPIEIHSHILSFLTPKDLASCRGVSQYFNTLILEDCESNKLLWDQHCVVRWGKDYIPASAKPKYVCVGDKIALYSKLYQLEKAALRHLTLLDEALWDRKFPDYSGNLHKSIHILSHRYLQGTSPKIAWLYLYGKNMLKCENIEGIKYLEIAAEQGYKDAAAYLGQRWLQKSQLSDKENGVQWLMKAVEQNHPVAAAMEEPKCLLKAIQHGDWYEYDELQSLNSQEQQICQETLRQGVKRKREEDAEGPVKKPKQENTQQD